MIADLMITLALVICGCGSVAAILLASRPACLEVSFGTTAAASLLTLVAAFDVLWSGTMRLSLPFATPFGGVPLLEVSVDKLSAFFLVTISVLVLAVSAYSIGYVRDYRGRYSIALFGVLFNVFFLSMVLVVTAANALFFLIMWETMSLSSYFLVVYESREESAVRAGLFYLVMTHIGMAFIMVAMLFLSSQAGSIEFSAMSGVGALMPSLAKSATFVLLLIGFGTKAGMVPLHGWLPDAHPAAPSNVSALMSGVMIKTAIYMLIRSYFGFLGVGDAWWGLLVLSIGSISALLGVLYALMEKDLKRILAYSSIENIGIIFIALGAAMVFEAKGLHELAALALIAALLHVLNHSLFKGLLFMGAGAVLHATGTKNIERMGGLVKRMKWTGILFFIGTLSIAAIPPFNGFVSEWLIFQSLLLSFNLPDITVNLLLAVALGMLALTGALAAAAFVRVYGITFLARPRSPEAEHAHEVPRSMLFGMGLIAALCVGTGVLSVLIVPWIDSVTSSVLHFSIADKLVNGLVLTTTSSSFSEMSPLVLGALVLLLVPLVYVLAGRYGGRARTEKGDTWDCGTHLNERNEYTATGYSQPINRVFNDLYRSKAETKVLSGTSPYHRKLSFSTSVLPIFEVYLYRPASMIVIGLARRMSFVQTGSIQRYLAFIFATLVLLLFVFR